MKLKFSPTAGEGGAAPAAAAPDEPQKKLAGLKEENARLAAKLPAPAPLPTAAAPDELQKKLAGLKEENARLAARLPASAPLPPPATPRELSIRRRVAAGLNRAQAEQSQADQERHDAWLADHAARYKAARN